MKHRSPLLVLIVCCVTLLVYLVVHSDRFAGSRRSKSNTAKQGGSPKSARHTQREGPAASQAETSCSALGVTCATSYLHAWSWPADGSCTLSVRHGYPVPDPRCTPGGVVPHLGADILRSAQWRTKCIRNCQSTEKQKHAAYAWYGLIGPAQNSGANQMCELDHLVPLELGGADGMGNIWPQCGKGSTALRNRYFKQKDLVEDYLASEVRSGRIPLEDAQKGIAADWTQYLDAAMRSK